MACRMHGMRACATDCVNSPRHVRFVAVFRSERRCRPAATSAGRRIVRSNAFALACSPVRSTYAPAGAIQVTTGVCRYSPTASHNTGERNAAPDQPR